MGWLFLFGLSLVSSIDPARVLVATIIDPRVDRIIRDSKLLFQSIRLFGGALNNATLLACIVLDNDAPFLNTDLVNAYGAIGVAVDFVHRVSDPFPGTMNKFSALELYDRSKFDYFLWLDADVVVFEDPFPLLGLQYRKGTISCVPEMYNYMMRFPQVNQSDLLWNPSLPKFTLVDDELIAPHGLCNTGVLFFDSQSVSLFLSTLRHPVIAQIMNLYRTDRFLDSLCFVGSVNLAGINVQPLDYALNYMAFLEIDIERLALTSHQPVFAHFIANSTLECYMAPDDGDQHCSCLYLNDASVSSESKIVKRIKELLLPLRNCLILAGVNPLSSPSRKQVHQSTQSNSAPVIVSREKGNCVPFVLFPTPDTIIFYDLDEVAFLLVASVAAECVLEPSFDLLVRDLGSDRVVFSAHRNDWIPRQDSLLVTFPFPPDLIGSDGINALEISFSNQSLHFSVVCRAKLSDGFQTFSHNYLINQSPIALHSQLLLAEYLNTRRLTERGLVHCCDTENGILVVEKLILKWGQRLPSVDPRNESESEMTLRKPPMLIIVIKSLPTPLLFESAQQLGDHFSRLCRSPSSRVRCVISHSLQFDLFSENIPHPSASPSNQRLPSLYRDRFLSFIYLDSLGLQSGVSELSRWYHALLPGGVMIGSEYTPPFLLRGYYGQGRGPDMPRLRSLLSKAAVIDHFGYLESLSPLFTSSESILSPRDPSDPLGSLPAWYFIKHDR
jgi:hypothetical protein